MGEPIFETAGDPGDVVERLNKLAAVCMTALDEATGAVVVLRHADVERLAHDPSLQGIGLMMFDFLGIDDGPLRRWYGSLMFSQEGPEHARLRRLVSRAFTPRSVERLRSDTRAMCVAELDALVTAGGGDLIAALSTVPVRVMCELLGIPSNDLASFQRWGEALSRTFTLMDPDQLAAATGAIVEMLAYVDDLVDARNASDQDGDDLLSALLAAEADGDRLTRAETVDMVTNLLVAGHDTTGSQIGCTALALLTRPDALEAVRRDPALVGSAVSETIRFEPSIIAMPRSTTGPIEVGGIDRPAGTLLFLSLASANRDPLVWERPDEFVVDRFVASTTPKLLSFGTGPHFCLGSHLARMTLEEVAAALAAAPLVLDDDPADLTWRAILGRTPATLHVSPAFGS